MLLRRSGQISEETYNLGGVTGEGTIGVENEDLLIAVAEAVYRSDSVELAQARDMALGRVGEEFLLDAIGVASGFNGITKIANATGLPLDSRTEEITVEMREVTGIDTYADDHKSGLYG